MSNRQERKARKAVGQQARFNKEFAERGIEAVYTPTLALEIDYSSLEKRALVSSLRQRTFLKSLLFSGRYGTYTGTWK